ncbi:MAG: hypothetical protein K0R09_285 [Clostridiales bacterium]|nr:hypothetical protein [Clostridiales bacterium]
MARKYLCGFLCLIYIMLFFIPGCGIKKKDDINPDDSKETSQINTGTQAKPDTTEKYGKPIFTAASDGDDMIVPYTPIQFDTKVKPYKVNGNLSNVENLEQYNKFTEEQKKLIQKNGFAVVPTKEEQLFYIYENNEYQKTPSFITSDSVLQVYHIFYDYSLRTLENEKLNGMLKTLTDSMLNKSVYVYNSIKNEEVKKAALKNIAYFYVAQVLMGNTAPKDIPSEAKTLGDGELKLIQGEGGFSQSVLFPYQLDYSQFKPRGHYTRNEELMKYFRTMMWYGIAPFPLYKNSNKERNLEQTLQALLMTYTMFMENHEEQDIELWKKVYNPTVFYVGKTDDLNIYDYKELFISVYGNEPDLEKLNDSTKIEKLYKEAEKLPEPKIKAKYTEVTTPVGKQFRLMGQRYIPDSEIIQELVEPIVRPVPSGLDVMGVLGSSRAYDILINVLKTNKDWSKYTEVFSNQKSKFENVEESTWRSNMYYGWLWVLKGFTKVFGDGYPSFMMSTAWQDKSLNTALGSWSELRHDTILYGKQSGAECGGGGEPPQVKGYVEPNIEAYERLLWLTRYSKENLTRKKIITDEINNKMQTFEDLLQFLINCSVKELKNEELTDGEYYQILNYGGMLEYLTSSFAGDGMRWYEITSETDKNMAVIADVHTIAPNKFSDGGYLEAGVGTAAEIYVVVPIGGKLYLTKGGIFSYYEFESKTRLTDEEWQRSIRENKQPKQPEWTESFISGGKIVEPVPSELYNSGC